MIINFAVMSFASERPLKKESNNQIKVSKVWIVMVEMSLKIICLLIEVFNACVLSADKSGQNYTKNH
jgi:hypothetical protein